MKSWRLVGVWLLVLVITTALTWQIVGLASDQVADAPVAAIAPAATTTLGSATSSSSPTTQRPTTTSSVTGGSSATTSTSSGASTSPSSSAPATSPTSSSAAEWSLRTITTGGGTVVVRYRPGEVELQAATPSPGFEMEIDDAGPPDVRVEFEADDTDIRVEARWEDGALDIDVSGDS